MRKKQLAVVGNRIILDPITEEKKKSGIILPDNFNDESNGVIIAVGPDADSRLKTGTKVVFDLKSGTKVVSEKNTYFVMRDVDLLYFFDEEKDLVQSPSKN